MPYGDQSYVTDGNAVRVRVWGKADEYPSKFTSLSLSSISSITSVISNKYFVHGGPCIPPLTWAARTVA